MKRLRLVLPFALLCLSVSGCAGMTKYGGCNDSGSVCVDAVAVNPGLRGKEITAYEITAQAEEYDLQADRVNSIRKREVNWVADTPLVQDLAKSVVPTVAGAATYGGFNMLTARQVRCGKGANCGTSIYNNTESGAFSRSDALQDLGISIGEGAVDGLMK